MLGINSFTLFPLQVNPRDISLDHETNIFPFLVVVAVIALIIIIVNLTKGKGGGGSSGAKTGIFYTLALHSIARNIGLNHDQTKMLEYVFKLDQVTEPEKSIENPVLLDRHFRRAYRIMEQAALSDAERQKRYYILFSTRNILENSLIGGMSNTKQIKDDSTLIINTGKDKINVNVLSSRGEHLIVEPPKNVLGSQIKIQRGTRLNVLYFNKNNKGFSFETRVIGYSSYNGHPSMQLAHATQMRFLSQRRYRRKQVSIACSMYLVYVEGVKKKARLVVDKRRLQGNIMDISVGGCSMKIIAPVQVGARFKIEFPHGNLNVAALGQVLRSNKTGMNTIIHIKFIKIPPKSMNLVNALVYEY